MLQNYLKFFKLSTIYKASYSTVTLFVKILGMSTVSPLSTAT